MQRNTLTVFTVILVLALVSCSNHVNPVVPDPSPPRQSTDNTVLWGLYEIHFDLDTLEFDVVPLRGAQFTCNITKFIDGPPQNIHPQLISVDQQPGYTDLALNMVVSHPFPHNPELTGFDVMGVFLGNGSDTYPGPGGYNVPGQNDMRLLNPDGYTRWFNHQEFSNTSGNLFCYTPGVLGSPGFVPSASINAYKYFCDGLEETGKANAFLRNNQDQRGVFLAGSTNFRRYSIRFPDSTGITFQYAVIGHWMSPGVPNPELSDFPPGANCDEIPTFKVTNNSVTHFVSETEFGGNIELTIELIDWSAQLSGGIVDEFQITCYSPVLAEPYIHSMGPELNEGSYFSFGVFKPIDTYTSLNPIPIWIEITYPSQDYTNPFGIPNDATGPLTSYMLVEEFVDPVGAGWSRTWGTSSSDRAYGLTVDDDGNSYVTGYQYADGSQDIFLAKYNINGELQWNRLFGGTSTDWGYDTAVDSLGNVYATGYYMGTADFDPGTGEDLHTSNGSNDAFLVKFDSDGIFIWARTWGGDGSENAYSVEADESDKIFVAGDFSNTVDFNPDGGFEETSNGSYDAYVSIFTSGGMLQDVITLGGTSVDRVTDVYALSDTAFYFCGEFNSTVDFDPFGGNEITSNGDYDAFLCRYDWPLVFSWVRTWGGSGIDNATSVDFGSLGLVVTGGFSDTVDFNPLGGAPRTSNGHTDVYLVSYHGLTGEFEDVLTWGGSGMDQGEAVCWNYVTGSFMGTVDFDPGPASDEHSSNGDLDVFLTCFEITGYSWTRTFGGNNLDSGLAVGEHSWDAYVAGRFRYTADLAPSGPPCHEDPDEHTSGGACDIFLSKFLYNGCW